MVERGATSIAVSWRRMWNSSRSSPAIAMLTEVRLCLQALRATTDLPASERGPVESWELRRFASILELEDIELFLWVPSNKKGGPVRATCGHGSENPITDFTVACVSRYASAPGGVSEENKGEINVDDAFIRRRAARNTACCGCAASNQHPITLLVRGIARVTPNRSFARRRAC